jgi:natural product biosynthesis luciferase-like monooxygenase protein
MLQQIQSTHPLTPIQQGMLFHHLSSPASGVDVEQIVCSLGEALDVEAFQRAWARAVARHGALRTSFRWEGVEEPVQDVHETASIPWLVEDWRGLPEAEQRARLDAHLAAERARGFDLREAPCLRLALLRTGDERWEVVWTFHHIVCDGRSFPIVLGDVFAFYDEERGGARSERPAPRAFGDHVAQLAAQDLRAAEGFWREALAGHRAPTPLPAPAVAGAPSGRGERELVLPEATTSALRRVAEAGGFTIGTAVQGAWALLLARHAGEPDVVFGATRAGRAGSVEGAGDMVGCLINTLPVRVAIEGERPAGEWLAGLRARELALRPFEHSPLVSVQGWSEVPAGQPLFESLVVFDRDRLDAQMRARGDAFATRRFRLLERTNYPLTLYAYAEPALVLKLAFDEPRFDAAEAERLLERLARLLAAIAADPARRVDSLPVLSEAEERRIVQEWNDTATALPESECVHHQIEAQAARTPDAPALVFRDRTVSYAALNARANRLAHHLRGLGVGPDVRVALCAERGVELVVALLAIHKAGGAYVPLDPSYPRERLGYMIADADVPVLVTQSHLEHELPPHRARTVLLDDESVYEGRPEGDPVSGVGPAHLAYVIYTSGSTGRPKGVMVEHRNVVNFFAGMDARIPAVPDPATGSPGTWLAVTSLSFDISVLELFWTLARGYRVVLHEDQQRAAARDARVGQHADRAIEFSLMYFASADTAGSDKYRLLLEGAKYADAHGFAAVWTPERHFHAFGGLYPNPSVISAAIAAVTRRIALRAGSVVNALHHPARIAEEWAVVDNLSHGRVGISFASGWQPRDFVLAPDAFASARESMVPGIEVIRRLWRGEAVAFPGPNGQSHEIRTLPRPVQPELPIWLTAAGSPETFRAAGEIGASILTHLLGQSLDEVVGKLKIYREAWKAAGHPGEGHVTLMLHTFVGDDEEEVRETVRGPMMAYLGSSLGLVKGFAQSWTAYKKRADGTTDVDIDMDSLSAEEMEGLLAYSFERYYETSALFGDVERALAMVDRLKGLGVDEVACLVDFGVDEERTLRHLAHLNRVRERSQPVAGGAAAAEDGSIAAQIRRYGVTHLQCTPSLASMLVQDEAARAALGSVRVMMIGGEAFPPALAAQLRAAGVATLLNMYGPTETTIWSAVHAVGDERDAIPIGRPIANTALYVLDGERRPVPPGVAGELYIGGAGVVRGYLARPELTAERFVPDPFSGRAGARLYRTGDLARFREDGVLEFLGRIDHQVKIRGHRIELGEIEATLAEHPGVREAVVMPREDAPGDVRLVGYLIAADPTAPPGPKELREFLRARLPEAMVPSHFVALERFPQTPNRKIDRKALPAPAEALPAAPAAGAASGPASELERAIAGVWQEVLHVERVGLEDNFFDLGGHSLLAVKAHRRLGEVLPKRVAITDLFRFPTVKALAEFLGGGSTGPSLQESQDRGAQRRDALAARRAARAGRRGGPGGES